MKRFLPFLLIPLAACSVIEQPNAMVSQWSRDWRQVATSDDRARLRDWRSAFVDALAAARKSGHGADLDREGALFEPDAALGGGPIPNGDYRCRMFKLGAKSPGMLDFVGYAPFVCRIRAERDLQAFAKLNGSQRPVGLIFPGDMLRQTFLGTLVLGDERRAMQYGQDETRDVAGFVERIGPARWRLVMPRPHFESQLDMLELVPSSEGAR
ncbi:MAG: DUF4893 domain-containing protein [Sphingomonas sp.]